jgi:hypothetical protein
MASPDDTDLELSTITVTRHERIVLARCVIMACTIVDALGDETRELLELHQRVCPEDVVAP